MAYRTRRSVSPSKHWLPAALALTMGCGSNGGGPSDGHPGPSGDGSSSGGSAGGASSSSASGGAKDAAAAGDAASGGSRDASTADAGEIGGDATTRDADAAGSDARADARAADAGGGTLADGAVDPCGPQNPAVVPLPVIGSGSFDVTKYGALGDGKTDDTGTIQAALDAATAAGGGVVNVPEGTFLSGPIVVGSGTQLNLASGAILEMLPMGTYPGTTAFITAEGAHDIALTGSGTIEGQGQAWWNALTATPTLARPQEVSFSNSSRVLVTGIRLQNPPEEHIWVKGDTDVTITGITIQTLAVAGQHIPNNTDGVDIGAKGVFFCGNSIACGDDNVVMEGSNIYVAYSNFGVGHGCSIGSITQNGVSGVTVDHVTMNGTTSGIRMKSARGRGGLVSNLTYSNMTMTNVQNPLFITSYYPTLPTDPSADPAQAVTATTPVWQNITIKNLTVTGASVAGILWGLPEEKISNLTLDDVDIQAATGMEIFHATGVSFVNGSKITVKTAPAATSFDATVTGIATTPF